jgi:peptidoglycan-N-acetylglucosamine deacetylase
MSSGARTPTKMLARPGSRDESSLARSATEKSRPLIARTARGAVRHAKAVAHRLLGRPPVVFRSPTSQPGIALTFDDGPSEWTLEIARTLEAHGCRGTFFLLGSAAERSPDIVRALANAGHEIGSHLWSHTDPECQSRSALRSELERAAAAIATAGGGRPRLIRPPYCGAPYAVARAAAGMDPSPLVVLRSIDPADWRAESADEIVERVLSRIKGGDIVCMHDGISPQNRGTPSRGATAAALAEIVPALLERGLRPMTVSELLA